MCFTEPDLECDKCGEELTKEEKDYLPITATIYLCFKCTERLEVNYYK